MRKQKYKQMPFYLSDEQAEKVGAAIAKDFRLHKTEGINDGIERRWQTENGTFTNKGIARRAHRIIQENLT